MGYEAPRTIGRLEKAAQLALKYGVIFDSRTKRFKGDLEKADKATAEMLEWVAKERSLNFRAEREW